MDPDDSGVASAAAGADGFVPGPPGVWDVSERVSGVPGAAPDAEALVEP